MRGYFLWGRCGVFSMQNWALDPTQIGSIDNQRGRKSDFRRDLTTPLDVLGRDSEYYIL